MICVSIFLGQLFGRESAFRESTIGCRGDFRLVYTETIPLHPNNSSILHSGNKNLSFVPSLVS